MSTARTTQSAAPTPTPASAPRKRFWVYAGLAGVVSAAALLAVAELLALLVAREGSPVLAVGSFVVDIVPRPLKEFAISTFGDADKVFLLASIGFAVVVAAALAGLLELVKPPLGLVLIGLASVLSVLAIVTRTGASALASVPTIVGAVVGLLLLRLLARRLRGWRASVRGDGSASVARSTKAKGTKAQSTKAQAAKAQAAKPVQGGTTTDAPRANVDRRTFFRVTVITAVGAAIVGTGARLVNVATSSLAGVRKALSLPEPASTVTIPEGADLGIDGVSELFTPNADFYRVDTALTVPSVDPDTWSLTITGMVDKEVTLSFQDLVDMGLDEYVTTLTCVSNEVGGGLVGNARWLGVPIRDVLALASPQAGADMVLSRSVDGYTASTPIEPLTDDGLDAILAVGMNGEPLPFEHGFPVRMVVPGLYGYVSATKWLTELKVTTFEADEAYWTPRGYSAEAPIKLSSRIDTPRLGAEVPAGPTKIAGVAWAQSVGIKTVEVSIDNGDWQPATLSTPINKDTWVQWFVDWEATSGSHYVAVRATDANGQLQIEERAPIAPNGSSGWQRTLLRVA